jgi:UDP-3-O-[3-hydroxymyristoyl] glucosamine N-acyltransferase
MSMKFGEVLTDYVTVGKDVLVFPFATVGFIGFSFEKDKLGNFKIPLKRRPHNFKVILGDNVVIGSKSNVDRGSWRDTIIGEGTNIDHLCHIAHNVRIGKHTWIAAGSILCGSCEVGDKCQIGAGTIILPHVKLGNKVITGAGAVVTRDVSSNKIVKGIPAKANNEFESFMAQ